MASIHGYPEMQLYYNEIKQYSKLTKEQEFDLSKRYKQGDSEAGKQLVQANLRFVVNVSRKYFNSGHDCLEIIQEGNLGLIRALDRFDPDRGIPFVYYAVWWVEATIKAFLYKTTRVNTGSLAHAKKLVSLDENIGTDDSSKERWIDFVTDGTDPEKTYNDRDRLSYMSSLFHQCFTFLSRREATVIVQRFYTDPPMKLKEIGLQLGVSRERVRQIQMRSMEKLRQALEKQADGFLVHDGLDSHAHAENIHVNFSQYKENQN